MGERTLLNWSRAFPLSKDPFPAIKSENSRGYRTEVSRVQPPLLQMEKESSLGIAKKGISGGWGPAISARGILSWLWIFWWIILFFPADSYGAYESLEDAIKHYKEGYTLFVKGNYRQAMIKFSLARMEFPKIKRYDRSRLELDRLIGICLYKLKRYEEALPLLEKYLRSPLHRRSKVKEVKKYVKEIRKILKKDRGEKKYRGGHKKVGPHGRFRGSGIVKSRRRIEKIVRKAPVGERPPHLAGWITLGIGVAMLVGGIVSGAMSQSTIKKAFETRDLLLNQKDPPAQAVSSLAREAIVQAQIADALFVIGGLTTVTGGILLLTLKKK